MQATPCMQSTRYSASLPAFVRAPKSLSSFSLTVLFCFLSSFHLLGLCFLFLPHSLIWT
ncbi:unnamed protein product, partial [Parascedosporium putredinis]